MTTWHAPADVLVRFATAPELLDEPTASSVEQHVIACAPCRSAVAAAATGEADLAASWEAVSDLIDRPRTAWPERLLGRLGTSPGTARLVAATRELRVTWLVAVIGLAGLAVALAHTQGSDGPFLIVAPLVPLMAVTLAFLPVGDPGGEASAATPSFGAQLVLRRVVAVVAPALAVVALAALAAPEIAGGSPIWLLPGLALALGALALSTYVRATIAAGALGLVWVGLWIGLTRSAELLAVRESVVFRPAGQVAALTIALASLAVVHLRRAQFSTLEVSW
ncbi:MAG: hypothetical protein ABWZ76_10970 [Acidimicrobiales bacterium]